MDQTTVLQHDINIEWFDGVPKDYDVNEYDLDHIEKMIREGYIEGELNSGDNEYRGRWAIASKDKRKEITLEQQLRGLKLHEILNQPVFDVMRVIGGWIYIRQTLGGSSTVVFVPDNLNPHG